ncbi:hypothetical protein GDO81_012512 [Engystomops pustulosus]|uniref:SH3 domain-containing protein n=1 Tax=Engystomops pustulosus TaxID=76066 RepID=A0AAV7BMZ6_ENGPU|nr:hypothetical protein GDO81_012512 [Engystomops pustulosus]
MKTLRRRKAEASPRSRRRNGESTEKHPDRQRCCVQGGPPHVWDGRRPGIVVAPVGAYHPSQSQGFGYMHQSSMSSMRSMHSPHAHSTSPSMRTFRAMYDYSAQDDDEVSFRDGDYIVNVQPIDEGWMYGTVQRTGKTGMLPANYIEAVN